jgi:hypothetical protein
MKLKLFFFASLFCIQLSFSQKTSNNAIGLRLGDNYGFGAEISYQRGLQKKNRLELDLGWRNSYKFRGDYYETDYNSFKLTALYQWIMKIDKGFNWYVGAGGGVGNSSINYYKFKNKSGERFSDSYTYVFVSGDIGIEYVFDAPIQIALDLRPELYINGGGFLRGFGPDLGLSIRYRFK